MAAVLLIDDDTDLAELYVVVSKRLGHSLLWVEEKDQIHQALASNEFDLIILDDKLGPDLSIDIVPEISKEFGESMLRKIAVLTSTLPEQSYIDNLNSYGIKGVFEKVPGVAGAQQQLQDLVDAKPSAPSQLEEILPE